METNEKLVNLIDKLQVNTQTKQAIKQELLNNNINNAIELALTLPEGKEFKQVVNELCKEILLDRKKRNIAKYGKRSERRKKIRENH